VWKGRGERFVDLLAAVVSCAAADGPVKFVSVPAAAAAGE